MASGKFRSKKEVVYDQLRQDILKGKYKPGERLIIDELASQLNASQIPIREAIQQLEADGFVTTEPYVGSRVAEINAQFIFEVFGLLEAMEIICSRYACASMTEEQLNTLEGMVTAMDDTIDDFTQWSEQNKAMHLFICECAETVLMLKMMQKVMDHWERLRLHYLADMTTNRTAEAQQEHKQLLQALKEREPERVEAILRHHNQSALKSYTLYLETQGHLESLRG